MLYIFRARGLNHRLNGASWIHGQYERSIDSAKLTSSVLPIKEEIQESMSFVARAMNEKRHIR